MKRVIAAVLFVSVILWLGFVGHLFSRIPPDFNQNIEVYSQDNFYDEEAQEYNGKIQSVSKFSIKTVKSSIENNVIKNGFEVFTPTGEPVFSAEKTVVVNRNSHKVLNSDNYFFAPPKLHKNDSFQYEHINYNAPALMKYDSSEIIAGEEIYKYKAEFQQDRIDQTLNLYHLPGVPEERGVVVEPELTLWIEPVSGFLVGYKDQSIAYYYNQTTKEIISPWNSFSNQVVDSSMEELVESATLFNTRNIFYSQIAPATVFFLAIIFWISSFNSIEKQRNIFVRKLFFFTTTLSSILVGIMVLQGWSSENDLLIQIVPFGTGMNPLAAVCFIILGCAVLAQSYNKRKLVVVLSSFLIFLGSLRLLENLGVLQYPVDLVLFQSEILASPFNARMAAFTAMSFILCGIGLIFVTNKSLERFKFTRVLSFTVFVLSMLAIFGFLSSALQVLELPIFFSAAILTSFLFASLSIVIFGLAQAKENQSLFSKGQLYPFIALAVPILITITLVGYIESSQHEQLDAEFNTETALLRDDIEERFDVYVSILRGTKGFVDASDSVAREEWKSYIDNLGLQENYQGIQGIGLSEIIQPNKVTAHEKSIQAEGYPDFSIRPAGNRSLYSSIVFLEPFDIRNQQAFGFDMYSNPIRRTAMQQSGISGQPTTSGRVTLVQEIDDDVQAGFLVYLPVYEKNTTEAYKRGFDDVTSFVYAAFRADNFVNSIFQDMKHSVVLEIYDGQILDEENLLYSNADETNKNAKKRIEEISVAGRRWTAVFTADDSLSRSTFEQLIPQIILLLGIFISLLISGVVNVLITARSDAITMANNLTKDLKDKQKDLLTANQKSEAIVASLGDGLVVTDERARIVRVNKHVARFFTVAPKSLVGERVTSALKLIDSKSKELIEPAESPILESLETGKPVSRNLQIEVDGDYLDIEIVSSPFLIEGRPAGAVLLLRDVSEFVRLNSAKTEFLSLASHQLRTPLSTISWYSELLLDDTKDPIPASKRDLALEIDIANKRLIDLVRALLDVSRIELGTTKIVPTALVLKKVIKDVVRSSDSLTKLTSSKVVIDVSPVSLEIITDEYLLRVILENLITNAIKYNKKKGTVRITAKVVAKKIELTVSDEGIGIPANQQNQIFKKMFRAENAQTKETDGNGLGLYLAKKIVTTMDGEISFKSAENKGTKFTLLLPKKLTIKTKKDDKK